MRPLIFIALLIFTTGIRPAVSTAQAAAKPQPPNDLEKSTGREAGQGDAQAQFNLGLMYDNGRGVTKDYTEAVKWYRKAAAQGNADAQFNLGTMYSNGEGVPQDYAEAVKWYLKAAIQGNPDAQFNLGLMYVKERGVPADYAQAYAWLDVAAAQGEKNALEYRNTVATVLTPITLLKAQQLSNRYFANYVLQHPSPRN
jgi:TPR repeat protein